MRVVLTYEDYAALPNDGKRYEIHDGELSVTPAPGLRHQDVTGKLYAALLAYVTAQGTGRVFIAPVDVILARTSIVQPDIVYLAEERTHLMSERGIEGAPTLAVETLSESTRRTDRTTKLQLYARYDVSFYWIVDPATPSIEIYRLESGAYAGPAQRSGAHLADLPPFAGLTLDATTVWP
ncbi:MAG: Uma2 family endonuclease [Candidatus Rokubacteria bacterium]|nr:Uma2 family endonuclease [Candidatus Rokubacteria bacterium]